MATMDWGDLHVFQFAGEELSFTRAAGRLQLSRQVVSQRVARLERTLGVTLLTRTTARMELTDQGRRVLKWAQQTGDSWSRLQSSLAPVELGSRTSPLEGLVLGVSRISFHRLHRRLVETWPGAQPMLKIFASPTEGLGSVGEGKIDGLLWEQWPFTTPAQTTADNVASVIVLRLPLYVLMPAAHSAAGRTQIQLSRLASEPFINSRDPVIRHAKIRICQTLGGFTPRLVHATDDQTEAQELITAGLGLDISASLFRHGDDIARQAISGGAGTRMVFSYSRRTVSARSAKIIIDVAAASFGALVGQLCG